MFSEGESNDEKHRRYLKSTKMKLRKRQGIIEKHGKISSSTIK